MKKKHYFENTCIVVMFLIKEIWLIYVIIGKYSKRKGAQVLKQKNPRNSPYVFDMQVDILVEKHVYINI